jgi:hypothetical protein
LQAASCFTDTIDDVAWSAFTCGSFRAGGLQFGHDWRAPGFDESRIAASP